MSSPAVNKLSFTIRRPTPVSRASSTGADSDFKVPALPRHLSGPNSGTSSPLSRGSPKPNSRTYEERDSSDEDDEVDEELVTGFDQFGVQRLHEKKKPQGPLVIPALKNRDWREQARKRRSLFVPTNAMPATGTDGSVGGLGTRDTINSGPQQIGLQFNKRIKVEESADSMEVEQETQIVASSVEPAQKKEEETEDQRAIRALLASAQGDGADDGPQIDVIPAVTEDDAYKQDVEELPDSATLQDYERVPVSQFGAALLRGMGWKEGSGASRTGKGPVQPYLPQARPALLGIGAKEKEVLDDGTKRKKGRPDKRYVPLVKKERREDDRGSDSAPPSASGSSSRRRTPSPDRVRDRDRHDSDRELHRERERDRDKRRDGDRSDRDRDRDRDRRRDDRDYRDYDSSSRRTDRDREKDSDKRRDRSADRSQSRRDRDRRDR